MVSHFLVFGFLTMFGERSTPPKSFLSLWAPGAALALATGAAWSALWAVHFGYHGDGRVALAVREWLLLPDLALGALSALTCFLASLFRRRWVSPRPA
jgi:hypothetical protein